MYPRQNFYFLIFIGIKFVADTDSSSVVSEQVMIQISFHENQRVVRKRRYLFYRCVRDILKVAGKAYQSAAVDKYKYTQRQQLVHVCSPES